MQILIVDDDEFALSMLENTLSRMGYSAISASDGAKAIEILEKGEIRLVITDWDMPGMNGIELCRAIRRNDYSGYVYVIMLTGREGASQRMQGLCAGADDFLNKPLDPEELLVCLKTAERILSLETRDLALFALAKLAESRDTETGAHIERVQSYSKLIAQNLSTEMKTCHGVDDEYIRLIYQTSPLHDLGKVSIPDAILLKPGKLTADEFAIMKTHTIIGSQTLNAALERFPNARFLVVARDIVASHHERFDGTGYPNGLAGEQIPLCGRIVAIADVYDALTSRRVYKNAMDHETAMSLILKERGRHFDPEVVDAFRRAEEQILAVRERLCDDVKVDASPVSIPSRPEPGQVGASLCKILVAEDDPILLAKLIELLSATGQTILPVANGQEALTVIEEQNPRVVISDWVMPLVDGVDLCSRIRAKTGADPIHFIMLTAHSEKTQLLDAYAAGVDDFISKPFNAEELLARVRAGIRAAKLHDELINKAAGSHALNVQLATLNSCLERLSITDELTGLFNRRNAMNRLSEQWALVERYGRPLSVAMIDIDHFKNINDIYGHDAGDEILRRVAGILREKTRGTDVVCRVGGEEFLIIFPLQTMEEAHVCAERCRAAIAEHEFDVDGKAIKATISIGLSSRSRGMTQFPDLLKAADQALYAAKHAGRNSVHSADRLEVPSVVPGPSTPLPQPETPTARIISPVDWDAVMKRCGGDPKFAQAVTDRFCGQAALEVGKLEKAHAAGEADVVRRVAHTLKSMSAYVSADAASSIARQIEEHALAGRLASIPPLLISLRKEVECVIAWIEARKTSISAQCA